MNREAMEVLEVSKGYDLKAAEPVVPEGYKQTEVGVIPEHWSVAPLRQEVAKLEAGVSVNSVDENLGSYSHEQSVLKTSSVADGRFYSNECKKIAPRDLSRVSLSPRADTLLVSRMNTPDLVGECGYVDKDFPHLFLPDRLWMTQKHVNSKASFRWLSYLVSSKPQKSRIKGLATGTSGSMKNIAKDSLLDTLLPFPPPEEQEAIATALSDVDALLEELDRLIAKKRDIKQATMQQLLTGQTRLPGFEGEWKVMRAEDVGRFRGGSGFPTKLQGQVTGQYPFFKVSDMNNEGNDTFMNSSNNYISEPVRKQVGAVAFPRGTIVFAKVGAAVFLERKKILTKPSCIDNNMAGYVVSPESVDVRFMHYALLCKSLGNLVSTTALPSLSSSVLSAMEFHLPPLEEQVAIAEFLSEMDAELQLLKQRRTKAADLKQAMMQELLTGRTRLL